MVGVIEGVHFCSCEIADLRERPSFGAHEGGYNSDRWTFKTYQGIGEDEDYKSLRMRSSKPFNLRMMSVRVAHATIAPGVSIDVSQNGIAHTACIRHI